MANKSSSIKKLTSIGKNTKSDNVSIKLGINIDSGNSMSYFCEVEADGETFKTGFKNTEQEALNEIEKIIIDNKI